ncbi:MAG: hypothetical protein HYZ74_00355 [Elusimicrobia bacterium]|nr:hypothetical protein [Elusimicrobiota bacterium]
MLRQFAKRAAPALFKEVDLAEPEDPAGPVFLAGLCWLQYAQAFDVSEGGGALREEFLLHTGEAIRRGEARLKKAPRDPRALMWLGAGLGLPRALEGA